LENRCLSCDAFLAEGASFCPRCGKAVGLFGALNPPPLYPTAVKRRLGTASWEDMKHVLGFYSLILGSSLFFGLLQWAKPGPIADVFDASVFIALVLGYLFRNWGGVAKVFRLRKPKARRLVELAIICVVVYFFLQFYFSAMEYFGWPMLKMTGPYTKAHWPLWSIFALICLEPGVFEEIAFRGIIQTKLSHILSVREALFIQAALFSIMHLSPMIFVSHFVMGLFLGWVRLRTGHLYFGMLLHMAWNAMCVLQELKYMGGV